jgi:hypothetical protein
MEFRPLPLADRKFAPIYFPSSDAAVIYIRKCGKNSMRCSKGNRHSKSTSRKGARAEGLIKEQTNSRCDVFVRYRTDPHLFLWITSHRSKELSQQNSDCAQCVLAATDLGLSVVTFFGMGLQSRPLHREELANGRERHSLG